MDPATINNLLRSQEKYVEELQQLLRNVKKDSAARKTEDYVRAKRKVVNDTLEEVTRIHKVLQGEESLRGHSYFTADYISKIRLLGSENLEHLRGYEKTERGRETETTTVPATIKAQLFLIRVLRSNIGRLRDELEANELPEEALVTYRMQLESSLEEVIMRHSVLMQDEEILDNEYFESNMIDDVRGEVQQLIKRLLSKGMKRNQTEGQDMTKPGTNSNISLPKINIPWFDGTYESWESFYDLFRKVIHDHKTWSKTEKMQYLKTHVRGEAAKLIKHLTVCDEHYETAWTLLLDRYRNERMLVTRHIDNILHLRKIEKGTVSNLKKLHDDVNESLEALKGLGLSIETWDPFLTRLITLKWDSETNEKYEQHVMQPKIVQKLSDVMEFLQRRFASLEACGLDTVTQRRRDQTRVSSSPQGTKECWYCKNHTHNIYSCDKFKALSAPERISEVFKKEKCRRCINHDKTVQCHTKGRCLQCGAQDQHSVLHVNGRAGRQQIRQPANRGVVFTPRATTSTNQAVTRSMSNIATNPSTGITLLATAEVLARAADGSMQRFRVLCDQGSEASFCTEQVAQTMAYPRTRIKAEISGIGDERPKTSNYARNVVLEPRLPTGYKLPVKFIVLPRLTGTLPSKDFPALKSKCLADLLLADPNYNKRGSIDIILGAREYSKMLLSGFYNVQEGVIAQNTKFGWILSGICDSNRTTKTIRVLNMTVRANEVECLRKFWELEEIEEGVKLSNEDEMCEKFYEETTVRNDDGSYTVRLPVKNSEQEYGLSRRRAMARLLQLEKRFVKDNNLKKLYQEFLDEYLSMGHMKKVPRGDNYQGKYYIPHQPVVNESSLTTKLRVVVDASSKASKTDCSLNDNMCKGPRLQQDLATILLRWRKHKYVFMADIEKMYRFIKVHEEDHSCQRILWRETPRHEVAEYELTTVTYGTTSAPYLAVKTLQQLAYDKRDNFRQARVASLN